MEITDVKTHVLEVPLEEPFSFSQGWVFKRTAMIVEVITDQGIIGWGESINHGLQPPQVAETVVEYALKPIILGKSPFDVEVLWENMYNTTRPYGQKGAAIYAISAIDIALWDIIGKTLNKPVHKLLGGSFRDTIQPYATGFYRKKDGKYPEDLIQEALEHLSNGFQAMKIKTGFGIQEDIKSMTAIRESVGEDVTLMMDANGAYNVSSARRIIKELEPLKLHWFEEPISPEDLEGYCELKNLSSMYIVAGESEFTKIGFRNWISNKAIDMIQPDLGSTGGFTESKKISALAQAWHIPVVPHVWGTGIGLASALQFIATLPSQPLALNPIEPMLEYDQSSHPFRTDLIYDSIGLDEKGTIKIPTTPGIGVEINREILKEFSINK